MNFIFSKKHILGFFRSELFEIYNNNLTHYYYWLYSYFLFTATL